MRAEKFQVNNDIRKLAPGTRCQNTVVLEYIIYPRPLMY
jgi:hypothetical protein